MSQQSPSETYQPLTLENLSIEQSDGQTFLIASGTLPCLNMEAELLPVMYIMQPEWWVISLTGKQDGDICMESIKPYAIRRNISHDIGTKGIEVVGSDGSKRFTL
jgi:hypothetical protein